MKVIADYSDKKAMEKQRNSFLPGRCYKIMADSHLFGKQE